MTSCNETIESMHLTHVAEDDETETDVLGYFCPFVVNNRNLRCIEIFMGFCCYGSSHMLRSLAIALENCKGDRLERFSIFLSSSAGDEDVAALFDSLNGKQRLSDVSFKNINLKTMGCQSLSRLIIDVSSRIRGLVLRGTCIDNDNLAILCDAISKSDLLKELDLGVCHLLASGRFSLSSVLSLQILESLSLDAAGIEDEGATILGNALSNNKTLMLLSLDCNENITSKGWKEFCKCFRNFALFLLSLSYCNIDDEGAATIASALAANTTLEKLNLNGNTRISSNGLVHFFDLLLDKKPVLETISMTENSIVGDGLKEEDWGILSRALCDKTSIKKTFESNHLFCALQLDVLPDYTSIWGDILSLLGMNVQSYPERVARQKILKYHFSNGNTGFNELAYLHDTAMPLAIEWIGREEEGYAVMFDFIQRFPALFTVPRMQCARTKTRKRKCR